MSTAQEHQRLPAASSRKEHTEIVELQKCPHSQNLTMTNSQLFVSSPLPTRRKSHPATVPTCEATSPIQALSQPATPPITLPLPPPSSTTDKRTTSTRPLATPHSTSFYRSLSLRRRRSKPPFFEGWYLRLTLPSNESFAWMFTIETPEKGMVQLLAPDENLLVHTLSPSGSFYAHPHEFSIGHWGHTTAAAGEPRHMNADEFEKAVLQGYQLSSTATHGRVHMSPGQGSSAPNTLVQWGFEYDPLITWGERHGRPRCTASVLSMLPLFDPGYQVLMAHGVARSGYVHYGPRRIDVAGAVVYCEKNWGTTFPRKWWWVQANTFPRLPDLSVTAVGSTRSILGLEEVVGLIAVHFDGKLYEFANWNSTDVTWHVQPWGSWRAEATTRSGYRVCMEATTEDDAVDVLGPSRDGMIYNVRDAARGNLVLSLFDENGTLILDRVTCGAAQVEVGGEEWKEPWVATLNPLPQPLRWLVNFFNGKVTTSE